MGKELIANKIEYVLENAWMGLSDEELFSVNFDNNPLLTRNTQLKSDPTLELISLMTNRDYLYWTVKNIFGVNLHPFQLVVLQTIWDYKFPMLIGSRGMSKCVTGNSIVQTYNGFFRMWDLIETKSEKEHQVAPNFIFGESGYKKPSYSFYNGRKETVSLTSRFGYNLEGTKNHPIRVLSEDNVVWKHLEDIKLGDYVVIDRSTTWLTETNGLTSDHGYLFGLLVGDGGYTVRGRISITTADEYILSECRRISKIVFGKDFSDKKNGKYSSILYGVEIWDELFQKYGFNSPVCGEKDFPSSILQAKKEVVASFIRGLFDTDGTVNKMRASFSSKSKNLIETLKTILLKFGIVSATKVALNKKYNTIYYQLHISGSSLRIFAKDIGFGLKRKQDILEECVSKISNDNVDLIPKQLVNPLLFKLRNKFYKTNPFGKRGYNIDRQSLTPSRLKAYDLSYDKLLDILRILKPVSHEPEYKELQKIHESNYFYDKVKTLSISENDTYDFYIPEGHSFISNGFISHNSYLLAVYCMIRGLLNQGIKIVIAGAAFRQSKYVFQYMETIWHNAPILRDLLEADEDDQQGPWYHGQDCWRMRIGESIITALPVGLGETIRGERAQIIVAEEFACLAAGTLVSTNRGFLPIERSFRDDIEIESALTPGLYRKPKKFIKTPPAEQYKVTLSGTNSFVASANHKVFLASGKEILVTDLKPHDKLKFPAHLSNYQLVPDILTEDIESEVLWDIGANRLNTSQARRILREMILRYSKIYKKDMGTITRNCLRMNFNNEEEYKFVRDILNIVGCRFLFNKRKPRSETIYEFEIRNFIELFEILELWEEKKFCLDKDFAYKKIRNIDGHKLNQPWVVKSVEKLEGKATLYCYEFSGKDRSFIGNFVAQHNSHNEDVFERVVGGFNVVKSSPMEQAMSVAKEAKMREMGITGVQNIDYGLIENQTIICGTADYHTGHFFKYWKRYKQIVESRGRPNELRKIFGDDFNPDFNWKDYCVIRLPYELLPKGFMDDKVIARSKATFAVGTFGNEFGATFSEDSSGFFKHSLIESCTCKDGVKTIDGNIQFAARIRGEKHLKYVYGIDPASEQDNFALVVLEMHGGHRRVVYCWTTNSSAHKEQIKARKTDEHDYYGFCARKIRSLMRIFPCIRIGIDAQGGGRSVYGALHRKEQLMMGEQPIWEIIEEDKEKDCDEYVGDHILEFKQFANAEWLGDANHGLRYDMENKQIIFPHLDPILLEVASHQDAKQDIESGLEDCMFEIEELKAELITIVHSKSPSGRDRWDLPSIRTAEGKKQVLHKDRYSALIIANSIARKLQESPPAVNEMNFGGAVFNPRNMDIKKKFDGSQEYSGPPWFMEEMRKQGVGGCIGGVVNRNRR